MQKTNNKPDMWVLVTAICLVFFLLFLVYPILQIFRQSVADGSGAFTYMILPVRLRAGD